MYATQYNNLRTDIIDNSTNTGHDHRVDGTNGKPLDWDGYLAYIFFDEEDFE